MESPAEIRNTIYKLVAASPLTSDDPRVKSVLKKRDKLWTSGQLYGSDLLHGSPEMMIVQPGLFAVCKQIRTEGLGLYYQHHKFACYLRYPKDRSNILGPLLKWLDTIGITGRTNIRHLRFRVDRCYIRREVMNEVHRKLLDEATVIWEAEVVHFYQSGPTELWAIGKAYKNENPKKLPIFETYGHQRFSTFEDRPYVEALRHSSLTFTPGMGWFGKENSFSAEEIDEDVQMEETAVAT